ncbi:MAG: DUF1573 domain-containing protein [Verrucomicrobiales bacterium]|nr:DUF1573 domain-containing protein [Verrucomicrobiales bacterium]
MRTLIVSICLVSIAFASGAFFLLHDAEENPPEFQISPPVLVLETNTDDEIVLSGEFLIKNAGKNEILLQSVSTSCGCAVAKIEDNLILPNTSVVIPVEAKLESGETRREFQVLVSFLQGGGELLEVVAQRTGKLDIYPNLIGIEVGENPVTLDVGVLYNSKSPPNPADWMVGASDSGRFDVTGELHSVSAFTSSSWMLKWRLKLTPRTAEGNGEDWVEFHGPNGISQTKSFTYRYLGGRLLTTGVVAARGQDEVMIEIAGGVDEMIKMVRLGSGETCTFRSEGELLAVSIPLEKRSSDYLSIDVSFDDGKNESVSVFGFLSDD